MVQEKIEKYIELTEQKLQQMLEIVGRLPEERLRRKPSADAWSVMEVLCHVEEATVYWLEEFIRVVEAGGGEWGRGLQHEGRLAAVARADERQLSEVYESLSHVAVSAKQILLKYQDQDLELEAPHRNAKFGTKPMSFLLDHFLIEHLDIHIGQIKRNLVEI